MVTPTSAPRDWSRSPISCGEDTVQLWLRPPQLPGTGAGHRSPVGRTQYSCGDAHLSSSGLEQVTDLLWGGHGTAVVTPTSAPRDWSRSPISCGEDTVQLWLRPPQLPGTGAGHRSPVGRTQYSCGYAHLSSPGLEQVTDLLWGDTVQLW